MGEHGAVEILGVRFFQGSVREAVEVGLRGGLIVAPSGPGMAQDLKNPRYAVAVRSAELAIPDSGYMVLLRRLLRRQKMARISGLALMRELIEAHPEKLARECLWVMPGREDADALRGFLATRGIHCGEDQIYLAPFYDPRNPTDPALLEHLRAQRPRVVILAIAGGKQEPLGAWLRDSWTSDTCPAIFCLGAAIAFFTGRQTAIPPWADRFYLGWLLRLLHNPRRYWRRYWGALPLVFSLLRDGPSKPSSEGK